jgi:4-amino-4-deoxy-L-arabinose transferase-like glycosyltransferase
MPQSKRKKPEVNRGGRPASEVMVPGSVASRVPGSLRARLCLIAATLLCLLPFVSKPFNFDDPLFVWMAKQIAQHPLDPYGFSVVWYQKAEPMSVIAQNPPLASYYAALIGPSSNWSETALHLAFLLPALAVVLATYELARDFTRRPALAAALTLAAPGFLVSATSIMCDVPMLAFWLLGLLAWRRGLDTGCWYYLLAGAFLIAACALTKYFGISLIPLLFLYAFVRQRRVGSWALYLAVPGAILVAYQFWSRMLYGQGLLSSAMEYANLVHTRTAGSVLADPFIAIGFVGGCMLPAVFTAPFWFRKRWIAACLTLSALAASALAWGWLKNYPFLGNRPLAALTLTFFIAGGIAVLTLSIADLWQRRDANSALLAAWVLGTFVFAAFLNWTVNARSILPLIPAAAILIARRYELAGETIGLASWNVAAPVAVCLAIGLWIAAGDFALARSARDAAFQIHARLASSTRKPFFSGHWGFQYYMQALGSEPVDLMKNDITLNDVVVQPVNNTNLYGFPSDIVASSETMSLAIHTWASIEHHSVGAAFYSSEFGPLPYAFGPVPAEEYLILRFKVPAAPAAP